MGEFILFLKRVSTHWGTLVTGGFLVGAMFVAERLAGVVFPKWTIGLYISAAVTWASFLTWKEERAKARTEAERVGELERKLQEEREEAANTPIRWIQHDYYWLLTMVESFGVRRAWIERDAGGARSNPIWIGEIPIFSRDTQWLTDLVRAAEQRGLLRGEPMPGSSIVYRLTPESERILRVERQRKREVVAPSGPLADALSGDPLGTPT